ncbi:MAG: tRNA (guanosine(37)-N1)-methyltransferase TrmD [Erysipelotrichaceae bacterium]|nr:tRNA (guanosine(37)-N1)-methyltransferase TrmD [Erysipelotrichaceae bacterium]
MRFDILTLFPEIIEGMVSSSILKRAIEKSLIEINIIDFREYAGNKHSTVDDYAYGGGAGMLIRVDPIYRALNTIEGLSGAHKVLTSPSGNVWSQKKAEEFSKLNHIVIVCGHYEGIDARVLNYIDEEVSIGDYVLTGGEIPAGVIIDSVSRLISGVIADDSTVNESFSMGLLEYPQYTRPQEFDGYKVPDILLSGHHANIKKWQRYEALKKTYIMRPELLNQIELSKDDLKMIEEIKLEVNK